MDSTTTTDSHAAPVQITTKSNYHDRRLSNKEVKPNSIPTTGCYTTCKDTDVMTSSIASMSSSLASPGDSGVQLLDSESDIASIMSISGYDFTFSDIINDKSSKLTPTDTSECDLNSALDSPMADNRCSIILNTDFRYETGENCSNGTTVTVAPVVVESNVVTDSKNLLDPKVGSNVMTTSDIANQNTTSPFYDDKVYSKSVPVQCTLGSSTDSPQPSNNIPSQHPIKDAAASEHFPMKDAAVSEHFTNIDLTNSSRAGDTGDNNVSQETSDGQADSTDRNDPMQTSVIAPMPDDQIVYRRQRRKKSKSQDAPKKRVSFHEDILNSTKIDDIHIDRGFITRQPDISMSFFGEDSIRRKGVVKGRYSWAAEGDSPYYQNSIPEREVKSDIICANNLYGSTSSSSSMSFDSNNSSNSSDESPREEHALSISSGLQNIKKVPKSSCLKKPKHGRKYIDTKIVQEENPNTRKNLTRKISESNILDTNIFGSLKNIYRSLSSSVPLAERGVPEGQEDFTVYSSTQDLHKSKRNSYSSSETLISKSLDSSETNTPFVCEPQLEEVEHSSQMYKKPNLRLSRSEGFYPNYPNNTENQPENIILCDSNVYEHRGISYSYEYDQFQNTFNKENKPKSSTVYQMLLKDLNFLKKSDQKKVDSESESSPPVQVAPKPYSEEKQLSNTSTPIKGQLDVKNNSRKFSSMSSSTDWSSDTETVSDISEKPSKHLQSPLKKRNIKPNHYTIQNTIKMADSSGLSVEIFDDGDKSNLSNLRPTTTSKATLINRFLRNVTQRKFLEANLQNTRKKLALDKTFGVYIKNVKPDPQMALDLENEINNEIQAHMEQSQSQRHKCHPNLLQAIKKDLFRDKTERLYEMYKVSSAYNMDGESKPLIVFLTNSTLYISSTKNKHLLCNEFVLPYTAVNFIMIGPNGQTIYFSNTDRDMQYFITTGSSDITSDLIGRIEMAMRKDKNKPRLPAIKQLTMRDMVQLRHAIYKQTSVTKDEDFYHYGVVNVHSDQLSPTSTPLGPYREGFLMYRKDRTDLRWQIGYFILKGGVLYTLSSPNRRIPIKVTPLYGGACRGARRTPPRPRPHTFELVTETESFEFAASDEYEASDWLQGLVQSASGLHYYEESVHTKSCSLVMTTDHLVTVRECFHQRGSDSNFLNDKFNNNALALSYAAISDLTAFRLPLAQQSWCVLEFACREVHETSGDWIIYFSTNSELDRFLASLEILWSYNNSQGDAFPLCTVPETEFLSEHASETYRTLQEAWITIQ